MLMKIKLSASYGNTNYPHRIGPSPCFGLKEDKSGKGGKTSRIKPCALVVAKQKSLRPCPVWGPSAAGGQPGHLWKHELEEKLAAGRSGTSNWEVAGGRSHLPANSSPCFQSLDWPPFTDVPFLSCLFSPCSLQEHLGEPSPFRCPRLEVERSPT